MTEKKELNKEELEKVDGGGNAIYGSRVGSGGSIYNDTAGIGGGHGKANAENPDSMPFPQDSASNKHY